MTNTKLIVNRTRGNAVCVGELADRSLPRMRGLIGRRRLPAGAGLLLRPAPSIHTAFMRFPIDALFLDRELRVLEVVERLRPWRVASKYGARAVLELPAGESVRRGVRAGDRLEVCDLRGGDATVGQAPNAVGAGATIGEAPDAVGAAARHLMTVPSGGRDGRVHAARLRPLSVVIISPDRRFATVMSVLLARRNCSVTTTANASRTNELIARKSADVVVVDADAPRAAAAIALVQASTSRAGLVLVAEYVGDDLAAEQTFSKWGPFDELMVAIERAEGLRSARAAKP